MSSWWKDESSLRRLRVGDMDEVLSARLIERALAESRTITAAGASGDMTPEDFDRMHQALKEIAVYSAYDDRYCNSVLVTEHGYLSVLGLSPGERGRNRGGARFNYQGFVDGRVDAIMAQVEELILPVEEEEVEDTSRFAYLLMQTPHGLRTTEIGFAAVELVRENYALPVVEQFAAVCRELQSPTPCGRLAVLTGPPGTGKTFWIRGVMAETSNLVFLFIPASLAQMAASPEMVPVLLGLRQADHRTVLIIEDADAALLQRDSGQQADISTLLNLTSGVIGELLDVCVIATTNAQYVQVDDALKREGRMICGEINLDNLSSEQATAAYRRLGGEGTCESMTLAQVYARARERGE